MPFFFRGGEAKRGIWTHLFDYNLTTVFPPNQVKKSHHTRYQIKTSYFQKKYKNSFPFFPFQIQKFQLFYSVSINIYVKSIQLFHLAFR